MSDEASVEAHLARLRPRWLLWLRARHRKLVNLHEDIVQNTSIDLTEYLRRSAGPAPAEEEVNKIGFTILRRRTADEYRMDVAEWAGSDELDEMASKHPSDDPQAVLEFARLLRASLAEIAKLPPPSLRALLQNEETRPGDAPLSDAERKRLSRVREDLKNRMLAGPRIDVTAALGGKAAAAPRRGTSPAEDMVPLLQVVHVTDMHVKDGDANPMRKLLAKRRRFLARQAQIAIEDFDLFGWNEGTQGNFRRAAQSFTRFLKNWRELDKAAGEDWYGSAQRPGVARTWLVDTGDQTAYGDERSLIKGRSNLEEWQKVLGDCELRSLYGNHDAWPEVQPVHAVLGLMPGEISAQRALVHARPGWDKHTWLHAPLEMEIPDTESRIELYGLDSVCWGAVRNTSAVGELRADDIQALRDAIRARQGPGGSNERHFRIVAVHHPMTFPYKFFEKRSKFLTKAMRLLDAEDRMRDFRNDRDDPPGLGVLAHLFLSGHTHACYPAGEIPAHTMGNQELLTERQLQLVGGPLMLNTHRRRIGVDPLETRKGGKHGEVLLDWTSCQAQILRFYYYREEPGRLTMHRTPVLADDGSVYVAGLTSEVEFFFD